MREKEEKKNNVCYNPPKWYDGNCLHCYFNDICESYLKENYKKTKFKIKSDVKYKIKEE